MAWYNKLSNEDRKNVGIVFVNRASMASSKSQLDAIANKAVDKSVIVVQDTGTYARSMLFDRVSGNSDSPKDDMAVYDQYGRLLRYFNHPTSNWGRGLVPNFLEDALRGKVEGCGDNEGDSKDSEDSKDVEDCPKTRGKIKGDAYSNSKQLTACDCRKECTDGVSSYFAFKPHKKEGKKGKCVCFADVKKFRQTGKGKFIVEKHM